MGDAGGRELYTCGLNPAVVASLFFAKAQSAHKSSLIFQQLKMSSDAKTGKGFRAKMEHVLYSGDKKHVFFGIVLISAVFSVPWYLMNKGSKHQSHQDYLEKADKARSQRLSSGGSSSAK